MKITHFITIIFIVGCLMGCSHSVQVETTRTIKDKIIDQDRYVFVVTTKNINKTENITVTKEEWESVEIGGMVTFRVEKGKPVEVLSFR